MDISPPAFIASLGLELLACLDSPVAAIDGNFTTMAQNIYNKFPSGKRKANDSKNEDAPPSMRR
ncbi:hypothetical protein FOXB_16685 [Fusarium oxysporum f. sp. conglutinans Fo5176]|uniref:Uncharacterized protein n=1 Tax=Fusarium oxysporum (strain Fo5176) TaxID=660025 RepID=F9GDF1_FUSOF|nr:hypothetical protein FOXB_16685 [Fusarium oxysporum f. sp. conglutinans Fo5176]